jgi:hypothetical protein
MKAKAVKIKVYLIGRMSRDPRDKQWREDITPFLEKLNFKIYNPYLLEPMQLKGLKPGRLPDKAPDGTKITHWYELSAFPQDSSEYKRFMKYMQSIIDFDLNIVEKVADIMIARWSDSCTSGGGSAAEVSLARKLRKPVYLVNEAKKVPEWVQGCVTRMFSSFEELHKFLTEEYGEQGADLSEELIN